MKPSMLVLGGGLGAALLFVAMSGKKKAGDELPPDGEFETKTMPPNMVVGVWDRTVYNGVTYDVFSTKDMPDMPWLPKLPIGLYVYFVFWDGDEDTSFIPHTSYGFTWSRADAEQSAQSCIDDGLAAGRRADPYPPKRW